MKEIKLLIMDVDGTLTDGRINIGENGELFKAFSVKDGHGIARILPQIGIEPVIITSRMSKIVEHRAVELNIKHLFKAWRIRSPRLWIYYRNLSFLLQIAPRSEMTSTT